MTKKLLYCFQIHSSGTKVRSERMAEAVPADPLSLTPALSSAGRIVFFNTISGVTGFLAFKRNEGNTKSRSDL